MNPSKCVKKLVALFRLDVIRNLNNMKKIYLITRNFNGIKFQWFAETREKAKEFINLYREDDIKSFINYKIEEIYSI